MFEILKALVDEVLTRGGTDDDMRRIQTDLALRAQIAQLIVVSGRQLPKKMELHLHPKQKNGGFIRGFDLEAHLKETGLLERCFSLEDELVKNWIANPASYPEEFKRKAIFLWGSWRDSGVDRFVAYLIWVDGEVLVRWSWLDRAWGGINPALLASI
jgi:hypothetical protein